jgi:hypothetical protein
LSSQNAYLEGELCGVLPNRRIAFNLTQNARDTSTGPLDFFLWLKVLLSGVP